MHKNIRISNWKITLTLFSSLPEDTKYVRQTHGNAIVHEGVVQNNDVEADGIIVHVNSPPAAIRTADCLPMIITAKDKAIALHISRKTLIAGILDEIEKHIETNSVTGVYLGPHICPEHFTFNFEGKEIKAFKEKFPESVIRREETHLSIRRAVQKYLDAWQVLHNKINSDNRCTYENNDLPSYRYAIDHKSRLTNNIATIVSYDK